MTRLPRVAVTLTQFQHRVPGGTAVSIARLVDALQRRGLAHLRGVMARGHMTDPRSIVAPTRPDLLPLGLPLTRAPVPLPLLYDVWSRSGRPAVDDADTDIVHVTVPIRVGVRSTPVVATVHDVFPLTRPQDFTGRGTSLMSAGLQWIRDEARAVMVPTQWVAQQCVEVGFEVDRITVVPWGVPPRLGGDGLEAADAHRRTALGLPDRYVLFVGTVEPRKNLRVLIEAMRRVGDPGLGLVLVGPDGWGEDLSAELASLATPVRRVGYLPPEDLAAVRRGATIAAMPSADEGFGLPVLEAMADSVPVVVSRGTACAEVGGDAVVSVDRSDPDEWAAALTALLDDDVAQRFAARGAARAAEFTWQRSAELTAEVYRRVMP